MRPARNQPSKGSPRRKVGEKVGVSVGGRVLLATIIEDRGDLGVHHQQVVRIAVPDPIIPGEGFDVEVPVEWLLPAPKRRSSHR